MNWIDKGGLARIVFVAGGHELASLQYVDNEPLRIA
jgi:hypothetical protein